MDEHDKVSIEVDYSSLKEVFENIAVGFKDQSRRITRLYYLYALNSVVLSGYIVVDVLR